LSSSIVLRGHWGELFLKKRMGMLCGGGGRGEEGEAGASRAREGGTMAFTEWRTTMMLYAAMHSRMRCRKSLLAATMTKRFAAFLLAGPLRRGST